MDTFRSKFSLVYNAHPQRRRTVRTEDATAAVEQSIKKSPNESVHYRATIGVVPIHFMKHFAERAWFTD